MKKLLFTAILLVLGNISLILSMNEEEMLQLRKEIEKSIENPNSIRFYYAPKKFQIEFEALTDKEKLETITTWIDSSTKKQHYTIEYHNPFDTRILYDKTGFIKPCTINKEIYDQKKNEIQKNWNSWKGIRDKHTKLIHIRDQYPNKICMFSTLSWVYNNGECIFYHGDNLRNLWSHSFTLRSDFKKGDFETFNFQKNTYNNQPIIMYKKLLQELELLEKKRFEKNTIIEYDCNIFYEENEKKKEDSLFRWIYAKEIANKIKKEKEEEELNDVLEDALNIYDQLNQK